MNAGNQWSSMLAGADKDPSYQEKRQLEEEGLLPWETDDDDFRENRSRHRERDRDQDRDRSYSDRRNNDHCGSHDRRKRYRDDESDGERRRSVSKQRDVDRPRPRQTRVIPVDARYTHCMMMIFAF